MDEAKAIRREAEARSKEYAARLAGLDQEVVGTKAALAEVGEGEKARIVREAEEKGERMRKDAVFLLEQERKQARIDLQRDAVQRALADAEGLLRTRLTPADHERIAEEFLAGIAAPSATPARPAGGES
jgi:F-type H+-transporting ATPase subunit b